MAARAGTTEAKTPAACERSGQIGRGEAPPCGYAAPPSKRITRGRGMASAKKGAAKAGAAALAVRQSPAVQRLLQDGENIAEAYLSLRNAYTRLNHGKAPTKVLFDDKKFQKELSKAAENLRDAGEALREGPKRKKRRLGRIVLLGVVGAVTAVALSEDLRKKVLDLLFGAEEEFDYPSTTTPPAPAPAAGATTPA